VVFSARSIPMAAHSKIDTATEERCFLCGPCLDVLNRSVSGESSVETSESVGRQLEDRCNSSL
jgi:hypothetical protein